MHFYLRMIIRICIHYTFIMAIIAIYNSLLIKYANQIVQEAKGNGDAQYGTKTHCQSIMFCVIFAILQQ